MTPRIQPVSLADADPETHELLSALSTLRGDDAEVLNVFRTMAQHPKLMKRWLVFANHVLTKSTLPGREREMAILRAGWCCHAPYEWGQHVGIGKREGLTDDEIERIASGPDAPGWSPHERGDPACCRRAARELGHLGRDVGDARRDVQPGADDGPRVRHRAVPTLVSFALNSFGVERDDGLDDTAIPSRLRRRSRA